MQLWGVCFPQLPRCPDLSELQNEVSSLITENEKLQKEKEALSEELNRCIDKVRKNCKSTSLRAVKIPKFYLYPHNL